MCASPGKKRTLGSDEAVSAEAARTALPDGVPASWEYSLSLYRDLSVLRLILKIFFFICLGMGVFLALLQAFDGPGGWRGVPDAVLPMGLVFGILAGISVLGYFLYALIMGGSYDMLFTMDGEKVVHSQHPRQFERYRRLAFLMIFLSLFQKGGSRYRMAGTGLATASRQSMTSDFARVKSIEADPAHEVIHLLCGPSRNRIYVPASQYEAVLGHIRACCPKASFFQTAPR